MTFIGVDLGFGEFALTAILLLLMYGISVMHLTALKGRSYVDKPLVKRGAVWAIIGIVFALTFGTLAALGTGLPFEGPALAFVLLFPGRWVWAELAHGRVVSTADVDHELDDVYRRIILKTLECTSPQSEGDLWEAVSQDRLVLAIESLPLGLDMRGIGPGIVDVMRDWKLSHDRFHRLVERMCARPEGGVKRNKDDTLSPRP